jgi:diketogulonate reductase-like aldo/keto reductase
MNRRNFIKVSAAASLPVNASNAAVQARINTRPIPVSGELLPEIGLGTWQTFDVGENLSARAKLEPVLSELVSQGASVVDSSPMYGSSESVLGDLAKKLDLQSDLFTATKVWTEGREQGIRQMRASMRKMNAPVIDLMQVHNLLDADVHLQTLNEWKQQGLIRYIGITHYHSGGHAEMRRLMLKHDIDFVQINYSIGSREAEREIFPIAQDKGIAVLVNRPFETGSLFRQVNGTTLPSWANEFNCHSWGQFFLKFILANPAVTCAIPGTSKAKHLKDNLQAGKGPLPSADHKKAMLNLMADLNS